MPDNRTPTAQLRPKSGAWAATHEDDELPNVHRQRLTRWVANVPASISVEGDTAVAIHVAISILVLDWICG